MLEQLFNPIEIDFANLATSELNTVDVAVVDSGVDATHAFFAESAIAAQYWVDERGVTILDGLSNNDCVGHGTSVAGIIHDIAKNARIHDFRVVNTGKGKTAPNLIATLEYCLEKGFKVINLSLAVSPKYRDKLHQIMERASRNGQIIVSAQRNMPLDNYGFPAEIDYCISVNNAELPSPFFLEYEVGAISPFIASGTEVPTPLFGGGSTRVSGTSFATPTISALCVLLLGRYPELEIFELKSLLKWHAFASRDKSV